MKKYRIIQISGYYRIQYKYKFLPFWFYYGHHNGDYFKILAFESLELAEDVATRLKIKPQITKS